jgi:hypothetical protein
MGDVANRDDAQKCLQIAESALAAGDLDKAQRFADKAMKLFPNEQVRQTLLRCMSYILLSYNKAQATRHLRLSKLCMGSAP